LAGEMAKADKAKGLTLAEALAECAPAETARMTEIWEELTRLREGQSWLSVRNSSQGVALLAEQNTLNAVRWQILRGRLSARAATLSYPPDEPAAERPILPESRVGELRLPRDGTRDRVFLGEKALDGVLFHFVAASAGQAPLVDVEPSHPRRSRIPPASDLPAATDEEILQATRAVYVAAARGGEPPPNVKQVWPVVLVELAKIGRYATRSSVEAIAEKSEFANQRRKSGKRA